MKLNESCVDLLSWFYQRNFEWLPAILSHVDLFRQLNSDLLLTEFKMGCMAYGMSDILTDVQVEVNPEPCQQRQYEQNQKITLMADENIREIGEEDEIECG
jgi:hypothetical protein